MDIQAEKIELMRLLAEVKSEVVLRKIKHLLQPRYSAAEEFKKNDLQNIAVYELSIMADMSFGEVWDNDEDEKWTTYLKNKIAHV